VPGSSVSAISLASGAVAAAAGATVVRGLALHAQP
jgi:hypothetical protein